MTPPTSSNGSAKEVKTVSQPDVSSTSRRTSDRLRQKTVPFKYAHCHSCRSTDILANMVLCTTPHCHHKFCLRCIREYGAPEDIGPERTKLSSRSEFVRQAGPNWKCLVCRKICGCKRCKPETESEKSEKRYKRPSNRKDEVSVEESQHAVEINNNRVGQHRKNISKDFIKSFLTEPGVDEIDGLIIYEGPLEEVERRAAQFSRGKRKSPEGSEDREEIKVPSPPPMIQHRRAAPNIRQKTSEFREKKPVITAKQSNPIPVKQTALPQTTATYQSYYVPSSSYFAPENKCVYSPYYVCSPCNNFAAAPPVSASYPTTVSAQRHYNYL